MKFLLDTHVFLWWITESPKLSPRATEIISDGENEIYISAASGWEIAIKAKLGRLDMPEHPEDYIPEQIRRNGFLVLPISMDHALFVFNLPDYHKDPFDRLLISQGLLEGLPILSADAEIGRYNLQVVW